MTETKELRIPFADLSVVAVQCSNCGAELVANLADERQGRLGAEDTGLACAICHERFSPGVKGALVHLARFYEMAQRSKAILSFRVRLAKDDTSGQVSA